MFGSWLGGWDTQSATGNEEGVYTDLVVANRAKSPIDLGDTDGDNMSVGMNIEWEVSDSYVGI